MRKELKVQEEKKVHGLEKAATKISGLILRVQIKWADWMRNAFERLGLRGRKAVAMLVVGFFSFMSGFVLVRSFTSKEPDKIKPMMFRSPGILLQPDTMVPGTSTDEKLINKSLEQIKKMDSLGIKVRESLRDSVEELNRIYLKQKNGK